MRVLTDEQEKLLDVLLPLAGNDVGVLEKAMRPRGDWPNQRTPALREVIEELLRVMARNAGAM